MTGVQGGGNQVFKWLVIIPTALIIDLYPIPFGD